MGDTRLSLEQYGRKVEVSLNHEDTTIDELMDSFRGLLVTQGYHPESFDRWCLEYLEGKDYECVPPGDGNA